MPPNRLFRREAEEARHAAEDAADEIRQVMLEVLNELEVYETPAWAKVEEKLEVMSRAAVRDIMNAADTETMILARERARVVGQLRGEPDELRAKLDVLRNQLREVEGETDG